MKKMLKVGSFVLYHFVDGVDGKEVGGPNSRLEGDCSELSGDCSRIYGNCSRISGDCSGLSGNCSWLEGNLDDCELTEEDRKKWVDIRSLVEEVLP